MANNISKIKLPGSTTEYTLKDGSAVANITRSGTTFTATKRDGTTFTFTQQDNNTTYTLSADTTNNQIKLTPSSGTAQIITVPYATSAGSASAVTWTNVSNRPTRLSQFTNDITFATSIATSTGTNQITLAANTKYAITAGGTSYIFTTPPDTNTWRGIQNNLTSDSTTDSLSAAQGKALANGSARDSTKLPLAGGTMTGVLTMGGKDIALKTTDSSSDDSSDIAWYYGNGQEKARLWTQDEYTAKRGLNYRVYKKDGTSLYNGAIPLADGTGASGTWDITAAIANKLGLSNVGSAMQPIYLSAGIATACAYTLGKSVPSNAVFTDTNTTYTLSADTTNKKIKLTPSSGSTQSITVPYASSAGRVSISTANPETDTYYMPIFGYGIGGGDTPILYEHSNDYTYYLRKGTTSRIGESALILGNDVSSGTDGNSRGELILYSEGSVRSALMMTNTNIGSSYNHYLPAVAGTIGVFTATPTSGQVVVTDGTAGGFKTTGYTIAKSVPSDAVFTDHYAWTDITGKPSSFTPASHTHGNIQNGGTLQTNDITIASGDKLVVTDSSDSSKVARTSISFDGSTTTKCLTQKGTWVTFGTSNLTLGTTASTALKGDTKYAGASTAGGSATSAAKLDTSTAGSATKPCYFVNGVPSACTYSLNKTVPSDAIFTDTTYTLSADTTSNTIKLTSSSGSAQSITVPYATYATSAGNSTTVSGTYSGNGGQQPPNYYGKNKVGFLMSNATIAGDNHYKNWIYMDNYNGTDVGGATAFGIDRTECRAFIMQSDANRTSWNNTAALGVFTATPTSGQVVVTDGTTGGIKSSGYTIAKSVPSNAVFTDHYAWSDITGKPSTYTPASHTHDITDITWAGNANLKANASANNQEWSIDLTPGSYTGTYWQVWSAKNSKTILACYTDNNKVEVPNGDFYVTNGEVSVGYGIELGMASKEAAPHIDFHWNSSTGTDYTARIWQRGESTVDLIGKNGSTWGIWRAGSFSTQSSIHAKENIQDITVEDSRKLLQLRPVTFNYKNGGLTDQAGLIAEEVYLVMPKMVIGDINYNPEEPWNTPSIDYSKFVPYLIKMIQEQQKEIDELRRLVQG